MTPTGRWSGSEEAWLRPVAHAIAVAFLSGDPEPAAMAARAARAIGDGCGDWLPDLAREMAEVTAGTEPEVMELVELILRCDHFSHQADDDRWSGWQLPWDDEVVAAAPLEVPEHRSTTVAEDLGAPIERYEVAEASGRRRSAVGAPTRSWPVPPIEDVVALATWFGLHPQHLRWYADVRSMERHGPVEPLRHYSYAWIPKRSGGGRLLEMPKPMLRFFQRRVLHEILDQIPLHPAVHGFRRGRSVESFADPHRGRRTVIRIDLESFFSSVMANRVFGIFRTAGYAGPVAHLLTGLTTNTAPLAVRSAAPPPPSADAAAAAAHRRTSTHLAHPHLPQGAPTSPALANLAAFGLDRRLTGLAAAYGATYTRYADDLAFSGGHRLDRHHVQLVDRVRRIVVAEGFRVHTAKTRVRRAGERQVVAGLVVNDHPQVPRQEYDRLRAVLHDAAINGAVAANRAHHPDFCAHLLGRIGWVGTGNPGRAARLRTLFDAIDW